ncbi:MAG: hypothetical protein KC503_27405, partial [Myxococcales bacterium]|nr:hypothetical protein [Myxococcales bacterium]
MRWIVSIVLVVGVGCGGANPPAADGVLGADGARDVRGTSDAGDGGGDGQRDTLAGGDGQRDALAGGDTSRDALAGADAARDTLADTLAADASRDTT